MAHHGYLWHIGDPPPYIDHHSLAKHTILREYLIRYLEVLTAYHGMEEFRLTLVDGFAGGGLYRRRDTHQLHDGSPLIMLRAVQEAEYRINRRRTKLLKINASYFFIDHNRGNLDYLKQVLKQANYTPNLDHNVFLFCDEFTNRVTDITDYVERRRRGCRVIFLLDQYGYSEVPLASIRAIFQRLPGAEIIFTFAVDDLIDRIRDTAAFRKQIAKLRLEHSINWPMLAQIKSQKGWRYMIQAELYKGIIQASGARYFNPFFIYSKESHRDYWLLHLCMQPRARDEMNRIHWQCHTYCRHFGGPGFEMLGYDLRQGEDVLGQPFDFDDDARRRSLTALTLDIPRRLHTVEAITFGELFAATCNQTPASTLIYQEALGEIMAYRGLEVRSPRNEKRRKGTRIAASDIIIPAKQSYFLFNAPNQT